VVFAVGIYDLLETFEIVPDGTAPFVVSQDGAGMIGRHEGDTAILVASAAYPADTLRSLREDARADSPKSENGPRPYEIYLTLEVWVTGGRLGGLRIPVVRGTTLHNIGNVDVTISRQADRRKPLVQVLSGSPHEGLASRVLLASGTFSDHHHEWIQNPLPRHGVRPSLVKRTTPTCLNLYLEIMESALSILDPLLLTTMETMATKSDAEGVLHVVDEAQQLFSQFLLAVLLVLHGVNHAT